MLRELPVAAFDAGGIEDRRPNGVNGYLVPWMDTDRYAARIDELLENKELARRMGERGLELVSRDYDSEAYQSDSRTVPHACKGSQLIANASNIRIAHEVISAIEQ